MLIHVSRLVIGGGIAVNNLPQKRDLEFIRAASLITPFISSCLSKTMLLSL